MRLAILISSLCIPGASLLLSKKYKSAILAPAIIVFILALFTLTRTIVTPSGFILCLAGIVTTHVAFTLYGWKLFCTEKIETIKIRQLIWLFILASAFTSIVTTCYVLKSSLLGLELYYIPSRSMEPTLQPGDIVLADTWVKPNTIEVGDIVVFQHPHIEGMNIIKRVAELVANNAVRVAGDNPNNSLDSRSLGNIDKHAIKARATALLRAPDFAPAALNR